MSVIPDSHADILDSKGFAHLASIGPDGEPQSHPVWFDTADGRIRISTTKARQKYRNLQNEPRVSLSILDPENPYRYLEVRGRVAAVEDDPDDAFINSLAKKYMDQDEYPLSQPGDERVIFVIEPVHATTMG
ncbi:MAG: PPOX class F420-dependent oxidoreductase [Acidimicrobiia bacterium]|nr:PPOX class F420-dependent oxidoreductase [Acidimicrobiia bacterium]